MRLDIFATAAFAVALIPSLALAQDRSVWETDFSKHTVPLEQIVPGGPGKDGIPALVNPKFVSVDAADEWLEEREPVMVFSHAGDVRAYPLSILIWHEIVNDRVGGLPVLVTYCPLCNIALVFDRRVDGRVLEFGTTGMLRHSDLVMYDRRTESWWQQATGEAIVGDYAGTELEFLPSQTVSWEMFKKAYPDGRVLSRETGYDRPYGRNPYVGYGNPDGGGPIDAFFGGEPDPRLPTMERVAAVRIGGESVAYPFSRLRKQPVVNDEVGGRPIVVFWAPGTASALDARRVAQGRDIGAAGVFSRVVNGRMLTFRAGADGRFVDVQTGSTWNILGQAIAGPLEGKRLTPIAHVDSFWFAWVVFRPETRVWQP